MGIKKEKLDVIDFVVDVLVETMKKLEDVTYVVNQANVLRGLEVDNEDNCFETALKKLEEEIRTLEEEARARNVSSVKVEGMKKAKEIFEETFRYELRSYNMR